MRNYRNFRPQFDRREWNGSRFFQGLDERQRHEGFDGREAFAGRHHRHHEHQGHFKGFMRPTPEMLVLRSTAMEVARLFAIAARSSVDNAEKQARLRGFLERSRQELLDLIDAKAQNEQPTAPEESAPEVTQA